MQHSQPLSFNLLLLAGGKSSRMGGQDKALIEYQGKPMIEHLLEKLPQAGLNQLVISCNRNYEQYKRYTELLVSDKSYPQIEAYAGPLLGMLSAIDTYPAEHWLILPCDTPELTSNMLQQLLESYQQSAAPISCLAIGEKVQPLHCLLSSQLRDSLFNYLSAGKRRAQEWVLSHNPHLVDCCDEAAHLVNINAPSDLN